MRRYIEVPVRLLDIEGEGFHIMVKGMIHDKDANFLIDTGASRSVFDPTRMADFIDNLSFEHKDSKSAGVGSSDLDTMMFEVESIVIGELEIKNYEAVALDLGSVHEMYEKLGLPCIDGIIGGDLLKRYQAIVNYKSKKLRLTP